MEFSIEIGFVVEIEGKQIIVETNDKSNDLTYFYNGEIFRGVCVGQFIGIIRGPYILVGRVEKEFLEDSTSTNNSITYSEDRIRRRLVINLLGYLYKNKFNIGIISYPMIYNTAILLTDKTIGLIINDNSDSDQEEKSNLLSIGLTVKERSKVKINPANLFNTHIGIFGNTGSGKSNTLAKIYTELFSKEGICLDGKSEFMVIDFNEEYTCNEVLKSDKKVINLSTNKSIDRISIQNKVFWDIDTLAILFSATEKTQKPFLKNAISYFLDEDSLTITDEKVFDAVDSSFFNTFFASKSKESNKLLHLIYGELNITEIEQDNIPFYNAFWHETLKSFKDRDVIINSCSKEDIIEKRQELDNYLQNNYKSKVHSLTTTQRMKISIYSHLIYCISYGHAQYEHISPLIERLKSRSLIIDKLIKIEDEKVENPTLTIVSLRNCNTEAKKLIPLLLAKNSYNSLKGENEDSIKKTYHLIIDEAHNILSEQSIREEMSWKDYRLETFEEIIKEGRKFGYYVTLASQRPADISETIVSQLHNYFIHRLISEQDIRMINNTINTLDSVSKANIPLLAQGQCILTGTSFNLPKIVQITKLDDEHSPNSASADLNSLWGI